MCSPKWDDLFAALGDDPEFVTAILKRAPDLLTRFIDWREAIARDDFMELCRVAHTVKSAMEMLCFPKSHVRIVSEIESMSGGERATANCERQHLIELCETTERRLEAFQDKLDRWLMKLASYNERLTIPKLREMLDDVS